MRGCRMLVSGDGLSLPEQTNRDLRRICGVACRRVEINPGGRIAANRGGVGLARRLIFTLMPEHWRFRVFRSRI